MESDVLARIGPQSSACVEGRAPKSRRRMSQIFGDRRSNQRYCLELPLRYRLVGRHAIPATGSGVTRDLSSVGAAFVSDVELSAGNTIELWLDWPAVAQDAISVELHVAGRIVRSAGNDVVVKIHRHQFIVTRREGEIANSAGRVS
jgi:hypothetical protein